MKLALDARTLQEPVRGGIGRSLANLLPRLQEHLDITLLLDARLPAPDTDLPHVLLRTPVPGVSASWLQLSAPRWLRGFDGVFHCPFYGMPFACPVPAVVTLHDLSFEHLAREFSRRQTLAFRLQARRAASHAAVLLAPSVFVRDDIVATYGVARERVLVVPQAADAVFRPDGHHSLPDLLASRGISGRYVVALGGARRRNLALAVEAFRDAAVGGVQLVVVGREDPGTADGVVWVGPVDDTAWAALLAGADAFLYPTDYEGFGMPGAEALASGTPVVAVPGSALPEVLGDGAVWASALTVPSLSEALRDLLSDAGSLAQQRMSALGRAAAAPTWDDAATLHLAAYARAAGTRTGQP